MTFCSQSDSKLTLQKISWTGSCRIASLVLPLAVSLYALGSISFAIEGNSLFSIQFSIQSTDRSPEKIKQLILQLGDPDYSVRNAAEQELLAIGEPAIAPLRQTLTYEDETNVPDSEIRLRAIRLLILVEREVHANMIRDFVDGKSENISLDGWDEFSGIVGEQKSSRQLFVKTHQSRPEIFKAIAKGKNAVENEVHQAITRRLRVTGSTNANTVIGTLSAVLFMASHQRQWDSNQSATFIQLSDSDTTRIRQALVRPQMLTSLNSHRSSKEVKLLISKWLESLSNENPKSVANQMALIDSYQFKNQAEKCLAFASDKRLPSQTRAIAIEIYFRLSDQTTDALAHLLNDATIVGAYLPTRDENSQPSDKSSKGRLIEVQIRDLALAVTILQNNQDIRDFGFYTGALEKKKLAINQAGFFNDQDRKRAFESWAQSKTKTED